MNGRFRGYNDATQEAATMNERYASLLFLSTLAGLTACPGDGADDGNAATSGTSDGTSGADTNTVGGPSSASASSSATSDPDPSTSTAGAESGSTSAGADATADDTGMDCGPFPVDVGRISDGCVGYVALLEMCVADEPLSPECLAYERAACQYMIDFDTNNAGPECAVAYDELLACFSALSCREFDSGTACTTRAASWQTACFG